MGLGDLPPECGAWTGHHSLAEIERYIRKRDRRRAVVGDADRTINRA